MLRHQPEPVRAFCCTRRFSTGSRVQSLTLSPAATLIALERANLFLVPPDDRREWYRYHHLFADGLRPRLLSEQPARIMLLHQRAGLWCERHDLVEDAVRHTPAAPDVDARRA